MGKWESAGGSLDWTRPASGCLLALILGGLVAGCGAGAEARQNSDVTLTVTSRPYPEEEVLGEIYAQALEAAGFKVKRDEIEAGALPWEELQKGRISGFPDHLETALSEIASVEPEEVDASAKAAYRQTKARLKEKGLVPFPPAPFGRTFAVGVLKKTARERDLESLSDLRGPSRQMTVLEREQFCHGRALCLGELERDYGIVFKSFSGSFPPEPPSLPYRSLRARKTDALMLINTEGRIADSKGWLVLLEDDQHRFPAANAFWLTSQAVVDEAGPDYERAILKAQRGLSLRIMRELDAEVELEGKSPAKAAAEYLTSIG